MTKEYTKELPDGTKEYVVELPDTPSNTCALELFLKALTFVRENEEFSTAAYLLRAVFT